MQIYEAGSLRQRTVRGAAWTLPTSVAARAVGLFGTLFLARYLTPNEYGVVMAASIAATTASSVTTFGVGVYLVATADISRSEVFHASCWFLATGVAALLVPMAFGVSLGGWSGAPGLEHFLPLFLLAMLLERIVYVPERLLVRQLRFGRLSFARAAGELTFTAVSVITAAHGAGGIAVAWGSLARSAFRVAAIVPAVDVRDWLEPHRLRVKTMWGIVGYGMSVTLASIATFGMRRWDNLLISRYFGPAVMGAYNYAYNLADTPATTVGDQIGDVIAASFPHLDRRRRAVALVRSCSVIAMVMLPLSLGLAAVAPTVVEAFFDPKWSEVGTMLVWLAALSVARPIASVLNAFCYASARPALVLWLEWASLAALVVAVSTVGRAGVQWVCALVGVVFVVRTLAGMWTVRQETGIQMSDFLLPMVRPLAAGLAMAAGVTAARMALAGLPPLVRLFAEIACGALIYVGGLLVVARASCNEIVVTVRSALVPAR